MAPTICPGKKRQTRTIATTNIRRHGQFNQTILNIVNFVGKGPLNPKAPAFLSTQTQSHITRNSNATSNYRSTNNDVGLNYSRLMHRSTPSASNNHLQQLSFTSDDAVTSSEHSDTENSLDLRLAHEILNISSTSARGSISADTSNNSSHLTSSLSEPSSLSSPKEKPPLSTLQCQERLYQRYSTVMQANNLTVDDENDGVSSAGEDLCQENNNSKLNIKNKKKSELHSSNERKYYFSSNDSETNEDDLESTREFSSDMSDVSSDSDMETDDSDSMSSLGTQKNTIVKRGNNALVRDTFRVKRLHKKTSNNRNTDGLLSIAIKTIKLVKRNQLLQQKLSQLQVETSEFIHSVLSNPENRHFRENIEQKV